MSWEGIIKATMGGRFNEITDARSMLKLMVEENPRYKGDYLLEKILKYLEDYLDRTEGLQ
tara:strand:- start:2919 stop:3098 length:180 start_codon:yes stop_codon:yes gene_type:complete